MGTMSPLFADAFQLLRNDLYGQLDEAESLATQLDPWSEEDTDTACELIPALVLVIRGLLIEHKAQPGGDWPSGECQICLSAFPCPVVTTIHGLLKNPEQEYVALVLRNHARIQEADRTP